ncbi:uncharacterized protein BJ212DRAFT_1369862 [Suillus subaureus]|uniref:G domain-containing protein n=1 Tax=Suillus subaureus TaxID=48587 RepID=A0A9P7E6V2_9AGAM|nr:uncharacterized protein BJ212DRAFT_1369862 [Suillus subaureus]KAG1812467.1 hypothetical protein BJ212DRAFT_1369862 [Suillus subaureus]
MAKKKNTVNAKNVVIFGAMGAGKSSLINLIADKKIAKTGSDLKRCTLTWTKYVLPQFFDDGMQCNIFDTMGIENPELESDEYHRSIKNASRLLRKLDECGGTSLLVYCVKKQRVNSALRNNYQLFHEVLYQRRVPIVMVVTCLEDEKVMEEWWTRNRASLEEFRIAVKGHACVTTLKDRDVMMKYKTSREAMHGLIRQHAAITPVSGEWKQEGMFSAFMRPFKKPDPEDKDKEDKLQEDLEGQCGMQKELASKVAKAFVYT